MNTPSTLAALIHTTRSRNLYSPIDDLRSLKHYLQKNNSDPLERSEPPEDLYFSLLP